jgi:hypothetical protein
MAKPKFFAIEQYENSKLMGYTTYMSQIDAREALPKACFGNRFKVVRVSIEVLKEPRVKGYKKK